MEYLVLLFGIGLLLAFGIFVAHPFIAAGRQTSRQSSSSVQVQELVERQGQLYAAIKELEFDKALGKLSTEDFEDLRRDLEKEALSVMRRLDQARDPSGTRSLRESIEADILVLRQNRRKPPERCPNCAAPSREKDRFCSSCGTLLG